MSNIPEARDRLTQIAADLQDKGDYNTGQAILGIVEDLMTRRPMTKPRAPRTSAPMTKARVQAIKKYVATYPSKSQHEVATHFAVDSGRVSEVMHGDYD